MTLVKCLFDARRRGVRLAVTASRSDGGSCKAI